MASRSRGGCLDCKKAKVKCDELHPKCGTCHRRGYDCQGYLKADIKLPSTAASRVLARPGISADEETRSSQPLVLLTTISNLPSGTISSYDQSILEVYFSRHPTDLVISPEFVEEMNSTVLQVLFSDPEAVCDPLSAIGHIYVGLDSNYSQSAIVSVLNCKARILRRLRTTNGIYQDLERTLVLLLGLCALEVSWLHFSIHAC